MSTENFNKEKDIPDQKPNQKKNTDNPSKNPMKDTNRKDPNRDDKGLSPFVMWAIVFSIAFFVLSYGGNNSANIIQMSHSDLKEAVKNREVIALEFQEGTSTARGKIQRDGVTKDFKVTVLRDDPELLKSLNEHDVQIIVNQSNMWLGNILLSVLSPVLFVFLLYFFIYRGMKGFGKGAMSFGKSKARLVGSGEGRVTLKDVAGIDEAKEEVQEIIDFLKNPAKYSELGARLPKGVLLVGNPGTGKTLLAKAIAGEAGVPFFSLSGSDFVEMFVGVGASRVRDLFEQGRKNAPCIMFLDEIDAVGRHRGTGLGGGHDEREQTLNAMLVELDGFDSSTGVIMIAATNRPDVLDPALLRPGRFDRQVVVDLPDVKAREAILKVHVSKVQADPNLDIERLARSTVFFSGADLANLVNEAALLAAKKGLKKVTRLELDEARDKVQFGRERKSRAVTDEDKKNTAWHEAGHALVALKCKHHDPLHKVTIIPRGQAAGMAMFFPETDRQGYNKNQLLDKICSTFGGRAAEMLIFKIETTGASSDLKAATNMARRMVCEWGMSEMGTQAYGNREEHMFLGREIAKTVDYSELTAQQIDATIKNILDEQYARAIKILEDNMDSLKIIAEGLLTYETLSGDEIKSLLNGEVLDRTPITKDTSATKKEEPPSDSSENAPGGSSNAVNPAEDPPVPPEQPGS